MKAFLRQTLLGGLFLILPVILIVMLLKGAVAWIQTAMEPFAAALPFATRVPGVWALLVLVLVSFLAGLLLQTRVVRGFAADVSHRLAERFPFYKVIRGFEDSLLGKTADKPIQSALVEIEEAPVPAFVVEELADGRYVVFVPSAPHPSQGAVYILTRERVHLIDASLHQVAQCVSHWGVGAQALIDSARKSAESVE